MRALRALFPVAALILAACATTPKPVATGGEPETPGRASSSEGRDETAREPSRPEAAEAEPQTTPPVRNVETFALSRLPGWSEEDHAAALAAFQSGCGAARGSTMRALCARARSLGRAGDDEARDFFELNFRAEPAGDPPGAEGVLTAYFAPEYEGRESPDAEFSAPVRPKPGRPVEVVAAPAAGEPQVDVIDALLAADAGLQEPAPPPPQPQPPVRSRIDLAASERAAIERAAPDGALAWMRPEDLFFLQIQGSGVLTFPDGRRMKANYSGDNGKPFVAIARPMVNRGLLGPSGASGEAIRSWLAAHRGAEADRIMHLNPRYVFFNLVQDDGREPVGAAGVPLPAGRAIAVDPGRHAYGEIFWIDASAPTLTGAARVYRRMTLALDTGSAIRGDIRADLYIGRGAQAGQEAGRVRHVLKMTRLVPRDPVLAQDGTAPPKTAHETSAQPGGG